MSRFPALSQIVAQISLLIPAILLLQAIPGCVREKPAPEPAPAPAAYHDPAFPVPQFAGGRKLDTVMSVSLDGRGRPDYIVTSLGHDSAEYIPPDARADLLQIYTYDSAAGHYQVILADTMLWTSAIELRDITGDHLPELILTRSAGGNDMVASFGMNVYSGDGGRIRAILKREDGSPQLKRLPRLETDGLVVYQEFFPPFVSHAEAEPYVSDILAYRGGSFVSVRREQGDYFRAEADARLKEYQTARTRVMNDTTRANDVDTSKIGGVDSIEAPDSLDSRGDLFRAAALVLIDFKLAGAGAAVRSFWDSERDFMKMRLREEQYQELARIYSESVAQ